MNTPYCVTCLMLRSMYSLGKAVWHPWINADNCVNQIARYHCARLWSYYVPHKNALLEWCVPISHNNDVIMSGIASQNHQPHDCLLNCLFRRRWKKPSKLRVTSLCAGNSPVTGEFPAQKASNAENVSIWWRHHHIVWWGETWWKYGLPDRVVVPLSTPGKRVIECYPNTQQ